MNKISNWLWGLVLITIGAIWAVNVLGLVQMNLFFPGWWTMFIIVPCFINLFSYDESKIWNLAGLVIGFCFLLGCLGIFSLSIIWKLLAPAILVVIGLSFIMKDAVKKQVLKNAKEVQDDEKHEYCATFSDQKLDFEGEKFEGAKMEAIFGGIQCDLRGAKIEDGATIKATSIFGGIRIKVPEEIEVKLASTAVFGGATNECKAPKKKKGDKEAVKAKKTLYVDATCVFGGVEVKA